MSANLMTRLVPVPERELLVAMDGMVSAASCRSTSATPARAVRWRCCCVPAKYRRPKIGSNGSLNVRREQGSWTHRRLEEAYPYPILDARYERVREGGVITSRAVLVAIGVDWEGWRQVLGAGCGQSQEPVELA